jgi:hypothetical protein
MTGEEFPRPTRTEPRGAFPVHGPLIGRVLTRQEALDIARANLAEWIAQHGCGDGGTDGDVV